MYGDDSSISNEAKTLPDLNKNLSEDMAMSQSGVDKMAWLQIPPKLKLCL